MKTVLSLTFLLALAVGAKAIDLKPEPLQQQMRTVLMADQDDFDDFEQKPVKTESEVARKKQSDLSEKRSGGKSVWKAGLYSAMLPGLGESYTGHKSKAKIFYAVEAVGWIGFFSYRIYGGWREDDMIDYAAIHASADLNGRDKDFIDLVGFYTDIDEYNTAGRVGDRERPYLADTPKNHWRWLSEEEQSTFRSLKNRSREAYRRSEFLIGLVVLNRVVSIIDAVRDARRSSRTIDDPFLGGDELSRLEIQINPLDQSQQVRLTWHPGF
ncbi:MAG: hypothetical protein P1R58_10190 [bacterium]|nr:hypothetical protein [bacterium]